MRPRSTIVYLLIAVGLALVYLYDIHRERKRQEAQESSERLFHVLPEDIGSITITRPDRTVQLQKRETTKGSRWWISAPVEYPADDTIARNLAGELASLRSLRMIPEGHRNLSEFGLQEPRLTIQFTAAGESFRLVVGQMVPTEDGYYVQTAHEGPVRIISDLDQAELDKELNQLKRRELFTLSMDEVSRFVITRGSETWQFISQNDRWIFEDDPELPVQSQKVNSLLIRFARARALSFVDGSAAALESCGLDDPTIMVSLSDGKITESLLLGRPVSNGTARYARMKKSEQVVTVSDALAEALPASREELEAEAADSGNL